MSKIQTNLDLTLESTFEHEKGDVLESVRQQVEVGIFHLQTLFKMAKRSAENINSTLDDESGDIEEFLYDVRNTSDLGYAVTMSIWKAISELTELQMKDYQPNEIEKPIEKVLGANKTAERLETLLNSDDAPDALKASLFALLDAESFEQNLTFNDSRIIKQSFPLLLESIGGESARVFHSAIENLIDSFPSVKKSEVSH